MDSLQQFKPTCLSPVGHMHPINISHMLVCVHTRMQRGHMTLNSECYRSSLSGQAVKVNSGIIYIRLGEEVDSDKPVRSTLLCKSLLSTNLSSSFFLPQLSQNTRQELKTRDLQKGVSREQECVIWCQVIKVCGSRPLGFR